MKTLPLPEAVSLVGIFVFVALIMPLRAQPALSFATARTFDAGPNPGTVAVGDFNGDSKLDLATLRSVVLGNGDGTFQAPISHSIGSDGTDVSSLAVGDFNGEGKADLLATTVGNPFGPPGAGSVWVLLGNGDGTFETGSSNRVGYFANSMAVGDFNGDGKFDLVVVNGMGTNMSVLLGKGDGTFQDAVNFSYSIFRKPTSVVVGDLNGDGKTDLAVADSGGCRCYWAMATVRSGKSSASERVKILRP